MSASIDAGRTYLAVPYEQKDEAKRLGARWDAEARAWFVPPGGDPEPFRAWVPEATSAQVLADPHDAFAAALHDAGLKLDSPPRMDGHIHRIQAEGDDRWQRSGAYFGHLDGKPAGFIQNFRTGLKKNWKLDGAGLDAEERARLNATTAQKRHSRAAEREAGHHQAAQRAEALWASAKPVEAHPYLSAKGVQAHGLRQNEDGALLVPVRDAAGTLWSLQRITPDGLKGFMKDSQIAGGHHVIGDVNQPGPLLIAEGYATAAEVHELMAMPVAVAFNAGNLLAVAETYRAQYPDRAIYVAGDNDHRREAEGKLNVGRMKAEEAAAAIGGVAILPRFEAHETGSDWNDLAQLHGRKDARTQLLTAVAIAERGRIEMNNTKLVIEEVQDTARALAGRPGDKELQTELRGLVGEVEATSEAGEFLAGDGVDPSSVARMGAAQLSELAADMDIMKSSIDAKIAERERMVAAMATARETVREPAERGAELER